MKNIDLSYLKGKKYILACSFGPDSMALLNSAINSNLDIVVAHVNYHKREASNFEEQSLRMFCREKNIPLEVLDTTGMTANNNFQEWARELRYRFFEKVVDKYKAYGVLVAHQKDDVIETYLMQERRKAFVKKYGISELSHIYSIDIIRPLLSYTKAELEEYDRENNVPYSIDCSNLEDHYDRNKIRHQIIEKMTDEEKNKLIVKINEFEKQNTIIPKTKISVSEFLKFHDYQILLLLDFYMNKTGKHKDISFGFIREIKKAFERNKSVGFDITEFIRIEKDYDNIYIINLTRLKSYSCEFSKTFENDFISVDFTQGTDDRKFNSEGILKLKNIDEGTTYKISNYCCKINRLFIDWKMPLFLRKMWPGVYTAENDLLYVPRYREIFEDNHKSKFFINIDYLLNFD